MRIVVIDPFKKTITEGQLANAAALDHLLKDGADHVRMAAPVQNGATGDTLRVNTAATGPKWTFLGDTYRGKAAIVGRDIIDDADVPLERVKSQVQF